MKKLMKVIEKRNIKSRFSFEAPLINMSSNLKFKVEEFYVSDFSMYSLLEGNPKNYFLVEVNGESMIDKNIMNGDILLVDSRSLPKDGDIIVAAIGSETLVKEYRIIDGTVYLIAANKKFMPIKIYPEESFYIQGVVKHVIHQF